MSNKKDISEIKKKAAIVILAYADYESLELALASHAKFSINAGVDIYILQNGRGTYDCERTYAVAKRYHYLFPKSIFVIDKIKPDIPFKSLKTLFGSKKFEKYDYIIKLDDDVMVLTEDWVDKLCSCFIEGKNRYGDQFAYATSLVNNNPYGFKKIIENSKTLADEYFSKIAREHYVGNSGPDDTFGPHRILPKERIYTGANGTIWRYPYIARWLHKKTTLDPEKYINFTSKLGIESVNEKERYSINCLLFEKKIWLHELPFVEPKCTDDEHLLQAYCLKYNKKILADLSIPMIHLFFFSQRDECKDMLEKIRAYYTNFLKLPFPISICDNRLIEIENRLRFIEQHNIPIIPDKRRKLESWESKKYWKTSPSTFDKVSWAAKDTQTHFINSVKKVPRKLRSFVQPKKICLVLYTHNDEANLPRYLEHVEPYVDFIIALDDNSTDGTKKILESSKKLKAILKKSRKNDGGMQNNSEDKYRLLKAAQNLGADWILTLNPDERFEEDFLRSLRKIVESSDQRTIFSMRFNGLHEQTIRFCLFPINQNIQFKNMDQISDNFIKQKNLDYNMYCLPKK